MLTRAGVVGSPVGHSMSPVLHRAAYRELGLDRWRYQADEVPAGGLARHLAGLGPDWAGLSVTMPLKEEALALADTAGEAALLTGAANTLLRRGAGWAAENTDVAGLRTALAEAGAGALGGGALVLGGGATARSALLALHDLGARAVTLVVRDEVRPATRRLAEHLDLAVQVLPLAGTVLRLDARAWEVVVGTLPAGAPTPRWHRPAGAGPPVVLDVVYAPWPSPLAAAVAGAAGDRVGVVRGTEMLLHQAVHQVELMTGARAPVPAMRAALQQHLEGAR